MKHIELPLTKEKLFELRCGDAVTLSGVLYTGRDAAHKRMIEALQAGQNLPFDVENATIYYVGPCPHKDGEVIGSCGPTTSGRMDAYAPTLIEKGLTGMIGKGIRKRAVIDAMKRHGAVYFGAIGGAGALLARHVKKSEVIAYDDLGTEAVHALTVENFPVTVIVDAQGNDLYESGKAKYRKV
ncbi:MAG: Fe-S-containing hydro-lyase [Ruminococcaceae bacterium]|nr:Fe-S-containing hydro-lyase [Oscillospiraceae bacterium]